MGEVYRARDPRLRRDVAVKVIHSQLADAPGYVERFRHEACAAGGLNHPNILAVYDVGVADGVAYMVSELLDGESLRHRLDRGALPYRKALDYGIQIAQALGAAHTSGIAHRDVKPPNVFITSDGHVKLLDFGLAKVTEPGSSGPDDSTAERSTGAIRGTAAYMSPEQARGDHVDTRTDVFSLGATLYEMFTGRRAFHRASREESLYAVLHDEPPDMLEINPAIPAPAAVTVRRCLEKNVDERFQCARDLAFQLHQLRDSVLVPPPSPAPIESLFRRHPWTAVAAVALLATASYLAWRFVHPPPPATFEQLTFRRARITGARFASQGRAVVYTEVLYNDVKRQYERMVWSFDSEEVREPRPLEGYQDADVLTERKGQLALIRDRRFSGGRHFPGRLVTAPGAGKGPFRDLGGEADDADWDPAGERLAAVFSTGSDGRSRLEYPLGKVLYSARSILWPRFSPDGRRIAFLEDGTGNGIAGRVAMIDLDGRYTRLTGDFRNARGLAWSPRGDEVWFTAGALWSDRALRAVDLEGHERLVLAGPLSITLWDIASDGRVLFAREEENRGLMGLPPGPGTTERDLSLYDSSGLASLSADGRMLLFADRFGTFVKVTDQATPPLDLKFRDAFADDISPDGKTVLLTTVTPNRLVLVPVGAGEPVELPTHGIVKHSGAFWLDADRVMFNGARAEDKAVRPYIQEVRTGRPPQPFANETTRIRVVSRDGQWAVAAEVGDAQALSVPGSGRARISIWPVAGGDPLIVPGTTNEDRPVGWTEDGKGLWVFRWEKVPAEVSRIEIATGRREHVRALLPRDPSGVETILTFRTTPNGDAYFYTYRRVLSKLFVARNLH